MRSQLEHPSLPSSHTQNRWIWVRDGLTAEQSLVSDDFFQNAIKELPEVKERFDKFLAQNQSISHTDMSERVSQFVLTMREEIQISYTGADASTYRIRVRDPNPKLAKALAQELTSELRSILLDKPLEDLDRIITDIKHQKAVLIQNHSTEKINLAPIADLRERITALQTTQDQLELSQKMYYAERDRIFNIVSSATTPVAPIWPRTGVLAVTAFLFGGFIGSVLFYMKSPYLRTT